MRAIVFSLRFIAGISFLTSLGRDGRPGRGASVIGWKRACGAGAIAGSCKGEG